MKKETETATTRSFPEAEGTIDVAEIAAAIKRVDVGVQKIRAAGVSDKLLVILINDATGGRTHGVGHKQIQRVLDALPKLRELYLTK